MKKIKQFIFYGVNNSNNNPKSINDWTSNLFKKYGAVSHLGIQGAPGVLFCLNGSSDSDAISIGGTGVYELDLEGIGYISSLRFLENELINNYPNDSVGKRLIVDIVYEGA